MLALTVLVIGTPRSGTNNCARWLRSQGLRVTHERLGAEHEIIDVAVDYHQLTRLAEWPLAIYLTREPIANVKSLNGLLRRKGQYRRTLDLFPELPHDEDPLRLACRYWLRCYDLCRHLPRWRAEDIPRLDGAVTNSDHDEGSAGIPEDLLGNLLQAGRELGYYSRGPLLPGWGS